MLYIDEAFKEMLDAMVEKKKWSPRDWGNIMDKQLDSWMLKIPGVSSQAEAQQMKEFKGRFSFVTYRYLLCFRTKTNC